MRTYLALPSGLGDVHQRSFSGKPLHGTAIDHASTQR